MTRRTALRFVAALFAVAKGERIMAVTDHQGKPVPTIHLAGFKPSAFRLHLDPGIRLEVSIGDEVIEIPQAELIAALKERP